MVSTAYRDIGTDDLVSANHSPTVDKAAETPPEWRQIRETVARPFEEKILQM